VADNNRKGFNIAGRKVLIAIPCYDGKINVQTAFSLAVVGQALAAYGAGLQFAEMSGCSILPRARNILVKKFLDSDCTDLLFIDADVVVKPESILRLVALSGDKDVVAGTYPTRTINRYFTFNPGESIDDFNPVFDGNGLLKTDVAPTGFMLIRRHVLETMVKNHPEWTYRIDNDPNGKVEHAIFDFKLEGERYVGEDIMFCRRAIAEGFTLWVDPMISLPHVGTQEFSRDFNTEFLQPIMAAKRAKEMADAVNEQKAA
jgi:hypothetical protein